MRGNSAAKQGFFHLTDSVCHLMIYWKLFDFLFGNPFFPAESQIKKTIAKINNMRSVIKSHTSKIGTCIILKSRTFTTITNGIINSAVIPKATNFLVLPTRKKTAYIIHKNTREINDITAPNWNNSFTFRIRPSRYRYGITKTLNDIKLFTISFFPKHNTWKRYNPYKYNRGDRNKWPRQIAGYGKITNSAYHDSDQKYYRPERTTFFVILFSSVLFKAIKFSSAFFSELSMQTLVPRNNSLTVIPSILHSSSIIDTFGILFPVSLS